MMRIVAESARGVIAVSCAVWPSRQRAEQQKDQDDENDQAHVASSLSASGRASLATWALRSGQSTRRGPAGELTKHRVSVPAGRCGAAATHGAYQDW